MDDVHFYGARRAAAALELRRRNGQVSFHQPGFGPALGLCANAERASLAPASPVRPRARFRLARGLFRIDPCPRWSELRG